MAHDWTGGCIMMNRRGFLSSVGVMGAASLTFGCLGASAAESADTILVLVAQVGGCDLLSSVIPLGQYGRYRDLRRPDTQPYDPILNLAIEEAALARTTINASLALHPRMTALRDLYARGRLAIVLGVGIPALDTNRLSHEAARYDWHTSTIGRLGSDSYGWVANAIQNAQEPSLPAMISTDTRVPIAFQSPNTTALAIGATLEGYSFDIPGSSDDERAARSASFLQLQASAPNGALRDASLRATRNAGDIARVAHDYPGKDYPKGDGGELDEQLKSIARLIASGAGTRAYFAVHNGYDTHAEQNRTLPDLLGTFSGAIARFYDYLSRTNNASRVLILSTTDFGRRTVSDNSFGTDHGTASVNFLIGDRVRGGIYGEFPDLRRLDEDKNLSVPVDFRRMLATGAKHLHIDLPSFGRGHAPIDALV